MPPPPPSVPSRGTSPLPRRSCEAGRSPLAALGALAAAFLGPSPALAVVSGHVQPGPRDLVVEGEVVDAEAVWSEGLRASIETRAWIRVERVRVGSFPGEVVEVVVPGGTVSGLTLVVEDVPRLQEGLAGSFTLVRRSDGPFALVAAESLGTAPDVRPYVLSGEDWTWQDAPVETPFLLVTNFPESFGGSSQVRDAFAAALETWNLQGAAAVALGWGGTTGSGSAAGEGDLYALYAAGQVASGSTLALSQWWTDGGHRMTDCDILFYSSNGHGQIAWSSASSGPAPSETDLQSVALHEIGHCLGLNHSASGEAVMAASLTVGTQKRSLSPDDVAGLQAIYGPACLDGDGDGFTSDAACGDAEVDCDDQDPDRHPGAAEACDGLDNDCTGIADDGLPSHEDSCEDGEDGDCDGLADAEDPDCAGPGDDDDPDDDASDGGDDDTGGQGVGGGALSCGDCSVSSGATPRAPAPMALWALVGLTWSRRRRYIRSARGPIPRS